jgi:putative ABC transport system permease protein
MGLFLLISRSILYFKGNNLATAMGIAIATAVICGALIIGDSLRGSLEHIVEQRLGNITHNITAGERIFSRGFGSRIEEGGSLHAAPVMKTEAIASIQGTNLRANKVNVWGIDSLFKEIAGPAAAGIKPGDNEVVINKTLAGRLMVDTGDYILMRLRKIGPIPSNTPLVSETDQTITRRVKVSSILDNDQLGQLSMQSSQSAPLNAFLDFDWLNRAMELHDMSNMLLIRTEQEVSPRDARNILQRAWEPIDGGISMLNRDIISRNGSKPYGYTQIISDRVFIDSYLSDAILKAFPLADPALTYFVNSLEFNGNVTPYSFVSAVNSITPNGPGQIANPGNTPISEGLSETIAVEFGQVVVNEWLADDLGVRPGDTLRMRYYEIGPLRELVEREADFMVSHIIPMNRVLRDSILMPHLPGLSDAGSCRDWEAGIPIDLDAIRQKDEDYWDQYKGTPKAYISLKQGQQLWQNRFGNLTSVLMAADRSPDITIRESLRKEVDPAHLGFMITAVREQGYSAARGGVDFGQLFAALGIFIIISGLLLTLLLLAFSLKQRHPQIKLFASLGFPNILIKKLLLWEAFFITIAGLIAGLLISIVYSKAIFSALNSNWYDIVRTDTLILHYQLTTLLTGLLVSLVLGMTVLYWGIRKAIKKNLPATGKSAVSRSQTRPETTLKGTSQKDSKKPMWFPSINRGRLFNRFNIIYSNKSPESRNHRPDPNNQKTSAAVPVKSSPKETLLKQPARMYAWISACILMLSLVFATYLGLSSHFEWVFAWLSTGIGLLLAIITGFYYMIHRLPEKPGIDISLKALGWKNLMRNPLRSFTIMLLLALGSFVIVVTASNRKEAYSDDTIKISGTGGFQYMAETTVPILNNLNQPSTRIELGLPENVRFVQFLSTYDDDASCLNLNMVANPRILATDPASLQGRFRFVSNHHWLNKEDPWKSLDSTYLDVVPAIADQSVIQWGLGKKVGDTLVYANARGEEVKLLLVGGLANSIFQGNVIISSANFLKHFPDHGGSNILLVETIDVDAQLLNISVSLRPSTYCSDRFASVSFAQKTDAKRIQIFRTDQTAARLGVNGKRVLFQRRNCSLNILLLEKEASGQQREK